MTVSVVQALIEDDNAITVPSVTSGTAIYVIGLSSSTNMSVSDDKNGSYGAALGPTVDADAGDRLQHFLKIGVTSGNTVVTVTNGAASAVIEVTGISGFDDGDGQHQLSPGTGADAVKTPVMGSVTGLLIGLASTTPTFAGITPNTGTGFASNNVGWNLGTGGNQARIISLRVTSANNALTWTLPSNQAEVISIGALLAESGAAGVSVPRHPYGPSSTPGIGGNLPTKWVRRRSFSYRGHAAVML